RKQNGTPAKKSDGAGRTSARATVSGPSRKSKADVADALTAKMAAADALGAQMEFNPNKASEYGSVTPPVGAVNSAEDQRALASTLTESTASAKVGTGKPNLGLDPGSAPLDRVRNDAT